MAIRSLTWYDNRPADAAAIETGSPAIKSLGSANKAPAMEIRCNCLQETRSDVSRQIPDGSGPTKKVYKECQSEALGQITGTEPRFGKQQVILITILQAIRQFER